jgi:hypothetical protein
LAVSVATDGTAKLAVSRIEKAIVDDIAKIDTPKTDPTNLTPGAATVAVDTSAAGAGIKAPIVSVEEISLQWGARAELRNNSGHTV